MWIEIRKLTFFSMLFFFIGNCQKEKTNHSVNTIDCVKLISEKESQKAINTLGLNVDQIEKYLYYFNFQISEFSLKVKLHSQPSEIQWHLIEEGNGIYKEANSEFYLGVKKLESGTRQIWIEKAKDNLFALNNNIGIIQDDPNCLNREVIKKNYILAERSKNGLDDEPSGVYELILGYHTINRDSVILRDSPTTKGNIIQKLNKGVKVAVIDIESSEETIEPFGINHWVKVRLDNNKVGYLFGAFVDWKENFPAGYHIDDP